MRVRLCILLMLAGSVFFSISMAGCVRYLETPTPPGSVPPPPPVTIQGRSGDNSAVPTPLSQPVPLAPTPVASANSSKFQSQATPDGRVVFSRPLTKRVDVKNPEVRRAFQQAYVKAGSPRIALFFNRQLSDQVSEWQTDTRQVIQYGGEKSRQKSGQPSEMEKKEGQIEISLEKRKEAATPANSQGTGTWMWRFEDSIIQAFLEFGVNIVDRSTIIRLTAAQQGESSSKKNSMSHYKLEMDALKTKADVFIELLVKRDPGSIWGYNFRASVKEVLTGRILASISSLGWENELAEQRQEITATSDGYRVQQTKLLPTVEEVTQYLATAVMQQLTMSLSIPNMIRSLFVENNLQGAMVSFDRSGRIELRGSYKDSQEVDQAFSLAQTVVGIKWVSPVVHENVQVREWAKKEKPPTNIPSDDASDSSPGLLRNKYGIVVGVGTFQEKKIIPLKYAEKDSRDFYQYLISPQGGNFKKENTFLLTNKEATKANIINSFNNIIKKAQKDDLVLLYFSTHGTPPDKFGGVHLVTYDSVVIPRQSIWRSSITDEMLREFISEVKAKRLVVIMDACYSNGAYKNVEGFLPPGGKSLGVNEEEGSGNSRSYLAKKILGAKDIILDEEPSVTIRNVSKEGWGRILFSASDVGEKSWESDVLRNSFFTHFFIEGLIKFGDIKQAFEYAKPKVTSGVRLEKDAEQHPQVVRDRKEINLVLGK